MNKQAVELRIEIDNLEQLLSQKRSELRKMQQEDRVSPKYGNFTITVDTIRDTESIRITAHLLNRDVYQEHLQTYNSVSGDWRDSIHSVEYFRVNNVLLQDNGGWCILKSNIICSDEEWQQIKECNIPERLLNKNIG